ncbi:5-oxoprolinase subunit B family protein [Maritimibacter alkaliphilus]|uniref:5-oxoprolinase subunit B family protein n=1 Tax=Maritimibacter alkaliphilus TaxID=404236 RepID=UPI001C9560BD|nr:carboxyltransferase domain-containing protein [Maritimibacter alkaliphilus]MBY6092868.1 allophanate hydrolase subunit 1 [Maritimibacter alkaliphilus]
MAATKTKAAHNVFELAAPRVTPMGSAACLLEGEGPMCLPTQRRIWAVGRAAGDLKGVTDTQPGMNNLLVLYDPLATEPEALQAQLLALWIATPDTPAPGKLIELVVRYGGDGGEDLEEVARKKSMTPRQVAEMHSSAEYTVFAPGVIPGFGYLFGLPEPLFLPRRDAPVNRPLLLNVFIAGLQCNVSGPPVPGGPQVGPTGWYSLGQLIDAPAPFDLTRDPPGLVEPGDRIRFILDEVLE